MSRSMRAVPEAMTVLRVKGHSDVCAPTYLSHGARQAPALRPRRGQLPCLTACLVECAAACHHNWRCRNRSQSVSTSRRQPCFRGRIGKTDARLGQVSDEDAEDVECLLCLRHGDRAPGGVATPLARFADDSRRPAGRHVGWINSAVVLVPAGNRSGERRSARECAGLDRRELTQGHLRAFWPTSNRPESSRKREAVSPTGSSRCGRLESDCPGSDASESARKK
jgi:hypothetical protein